MTNLDYKIRLILRLNSKLQRSEMYLANNSDNVPAFMRADINKAIVKHYYLKNVLRNLNYLNY